MNTSSRSLAVITGASSGIGYELAKQFVHHGHDVVIVASSDKIHEAAQDLKKFGRKVEAFQFDLAKCSEIDRLVEKLKSLGREIDIFALNAGVGVGGEFVKNNIDDELNMINLNVTGTVYLTKSVLQNFLRKGGKILFTSSIVSDMPAPFQAVYGATKAFVQSFANAIRDEVKDKNITITTLMPGATNTNFFARAHLLDTKVGATGKYENQPEDVAAQGYDALLRGEKEVFASSVKTKLQGTLNKFMPEKFKAYMHRKVAEPGSAHH